ncbi:3-isopropylmalate dehydrogenase [Rhizobium azooxidifex]|uniref:3-isopropylmalate dehydrogenase n=1 Tax=Mycoplana azooxidifex TaxID=1636188 RepID=A0A7W6GLQ0_9HYPH|nr:isocitrate/isopropylmalate family dehydrogenase [Mycoplana azooxidifex]MBB3979622.1 3-isopropylmalate dehydrogenase [Mycoplana azooxidifex]
MKLVLLPGDGIGPEISAATRRVLDTAAERFGLSLVIEEELMGHVSLARHGATITEDVLDKVREADGLILGPAATFDFKDESRGEINPSMFFRKRLDLFANIRPSRTYEGVPDRVGPFDLVVVRENTEGFYTDRNMESGNGEILVTADVAIAIRRITRLCCERIAKTAFELASARRGKVTFVHKANVLKTTDGMFLDICRDMAKSYPDILTEDFLVDAMMAHVVRAPARFDVIVTTNMYGDILSDLTAELSGSLGLGGSINAGAHYAMAQASHGSAPDIAGKDIANPISLILSTAQLLAWYGHRKNEQAYVDASSAIEKAVSEAVRRGEATQDIGGKLGTAAAGEAVCRWVAL